MGTQILEVLLGPKTEKKNVFRIGFLIEDKLNIRKNPTNRKVFQHCKSSDLGFRDFRAHSRALMKTPG